MFRKPLILIWLLTTLALSSVALFPLLAQDTQDTQDTQTSTADTSQSPAPTAQTQTRWYRSNQLGMALELLDDPRDIDLQQWGLEIESSPDQSLKTLYFQGKILETWQRTYRNGKAFQEQHKRSGALLENRFFDEETGRLSEISTYSTEKGTVRDRWLFFYDKSGKLVRSLLYDEAGQLDRESTYRLDDVGHLIKLKIRMHQKNQEVVQYQLPGIDTFVQSNAQRGKYLVSLFDRQRRNTRQITYQNNTVTKRTNFEYSGNGKLSRTIITEDQRTTQYDYNDLNQLLQKQVWQEGHLSESEIYSYDKFGRLTNKKRTFWTTNEKHEERYNYRNQSQDLQSIGFYINENVDKIRTYTSLHSYYEELYFSGNPVAKVYYDYDNKLYTQVTFQNVPTPEDFDSNPSLVGKTGEE